MKGRYCRGMPSSGHERVVVNPRTGDVRPFTASARAFHARLPGFAPTPLREAPATAAALGLERLVVKYEPGRMGLPAFKILGASYAMARSLGADDLDSARTAADRRGITRLVSPTDGNHGRAVAHLARLLGIGSTIHVPATMVAARRDAIRSEGADLRVHDGDYEVAVQRAAVDAAGDATALLVSDADPEGGDASAGAVIDGYETLFAEAGEQLGDAVPDLLALQMGVGGFAAAGLRFAASRGIPAIGAEPAAAACVAASIAAGEPVEIEIGHTTVACLEAGTPSRAAWPDLVGGLAGVVVIADAEADEAMRLLARDGIEAGESGAAGVAALLALGRDPVCGSLAQRVALADAKVALVVVTEGATDPDRYREVVGG